MTVVSCFIESVSDYVSLSFIALVLLSRLGVRGLPIRQYRAFIVVEVAQELYLSENRSAKEKGSGTVNVNVNDSVMEIGECS